LRSITANGINAGIGVLVNGGTGNTIENGDIVGFGEGIRATGTGLALYASRFEVDGIAMNLGLDGAGNNAPLRDVSISGVEMEANDTFILVNNCSNCRLTSIVTHGSTNAPSGHSQRGLVIQSAQSSTFDGMGMTGTFSDASARLMGDASSQLLFSAFLANN